jgi:dolichol-phosphate mannosyltransferase
MAFQLTGNLSVKSQIGVILPTYCEAQNIERLIEDIESLPLNISILVIDDSSPDGTSNIIKKMQAKYPNLLLLNRSQKLGLGSAITDGFKTFLSLENIPNFVVTMDADYSHNPKDLPRLVSCVQDGSDLVVGSRYCKGGKTAGWSFMRKIISRSANALARSILHLKPHDCTSGFRCYSTNFLKATINYLHSHTYDIQIETINQAHKKSFKVTETPILFINRKQGKSKLSTVEIRNFLSYILKTVTIKQKN